MTPGKRIVSGLVAYVFALVATIPASLIDSALMRAGNGRLRLVEAHGTLWSGDGLVEFRDADGQGGIAKNISWRCLPWSLIGGHLVVDVELDQSPLRFPVTVSFSRIEVSNADIPLPAAVLGLVLPKLAPLGLGGDVRLQIEEVALQRDGVRGNMWVQWRYASSALTPISPLGDYEMHFVSDGPQQDISLNTLQGPLIMEGKGTQASGGERSFPVTLRVPASLQQQLAPLLRLIAVEGSDGVFTLRVK